MSLRIPSRFFANTASSTAQLGRVAMRLVQKLVFWSVLLSMVGCVSQKNRFAALPNKYEIESGNIIIRSDLKFQADHDLIRQLKAIREDLTTALELPPARRPVVIHLFGDEERYSKYMQARHPNLPPRRAFFIGSPTELGVYAHWSPNVSEDLRHEYTHGVLHSCLRTVPLWLDEGLAEYYETANDVPGRIHREHTQNLAVAIKNGWRPNLQRLENIDDVNRMALSDYRESWAWVHFLMSDAPGGRELLVNYCKALHKSDKPPRFSVEVARLFPDAEMRLASYVTLSLTDHGRVSLKADARERTR